MSAAGRSKKVGPRIGAGPPDIPKNRQAWFEGQLDLDPEKLVYVDESGLSTKTAHLRGRAPRGDRCRAGIPHGQECKRCRRQTDKVRAAE